jgi:DNA repair protein RecO (recombination protein O)
MIEKTAGIILHSLKYSETSIIARVYTRETGLQSYLVPGVRKAKARFKKNLFQPLSIVELVAYHKERESLQHIKEISCPQPYDSIPYAVNKSSIALFLAEILNHALKNQEANAQLFDFLSESFKQLDQTHENIANFHLIFLIRLSRYLGFKPRDNHDKHHRFFNIREGMFQHKADDPGYCLSERLSLIFLQLINTETFYEQELRISKKVRKDLLQKTIDYYRYHLEGMPEIKSHNVLEAVLGE